MLGLALFTGLPKMVSTNFTTIRTTKRPYIIFSLYYLVVLGPGWYLLLARGHSEIGIVLVIATMLWFTPLMRYKVAWNDEVLIYRSVYKTVRVPIAEITEVRAVSAAESRLDPVFGLGLFTTDRKQPAAIINIMPFSAADIQRLKAAVARPRA